jgi:hypothetical protein
MGGASRVVGALPPSRAFVVQFADGAVPAEGVFTGRIEHIDSGRSRRFASLDELTVFVAEAIAQAEADDPT